MGTCDSPWQPGEGIWLIEAKKPYCLGHFLCSDLVSRSTGDSPSEEVGKGNQQKRKMEVRGRKRLRLLRRRSVTNMSKDKVIGFGMRQNKWREGAERDDLENV